MNRAPGPNDRWWYQHAFHCNGTFIKEREPPKKENTRKRKVSDTGSGGYCPDIQ